MRALFTPCCCIVFVPGMGFLRRDEDRALAGRVCRAALAGRGCLRCPVVVLVPPLQDPADMLLLRCAVLYGKAQACMYSTPQ